MANTKCEKGQTSNLKTLIERANIIIKRMVIFAFTVQNMGFEFRFLINVLGQNGLLKHTTHYYIVFTSISIFTLNKLHLNNHIIVYLS